MEFDYELVYSDCKQASVSKDFGYPPTELHHMNTRYAQSLFYFVLFYYFMCCMYVLFSLVLLKRLFFKK